MNEDNIYDLFCLTEIEIWQTRCLTEHSSDSKTKPEHISIPFLVSDFPPNLVDSEYFFLFRFVYIIHCSLSTHFRQMFNLTFFFFSSYFFFSFSNISFLSFAFHRIFVFFSLYFLTFFLHVFIQVSIHYLFRLVIGFILYFFLSFFYCMVHCVLVLQKFSFA